MSTDAQPDPAKDAQAQKEAAELAEFQKLTDPKARKQYWQEHPSIQAKYSECNFH